MLHACAARFDVMDNFKKNCKFFGSKQSLNGISRASIVHLEGAAESGFETKGSGVFFVEALFSSEKILNLATVVFSFYWIISIQL